MVWAGGEVHAQKHVECIGVLVSPLRVVTSSPHTTPDSFNIVYGGSVVVVTDTLLEICVLVFHSNNLGMCYW